MLLPVPVTVAVVESAYHTMVAPVTGAAVKVAFSPVFTITSPVTTGAAGAVTTCTVAAFSVPAAFSHWPAPDTLT